MTAASLGAVDRLLRELREEERQTANLCFLASNLRDEGSASRSRQVMAANAFIDKQKRLIDLLLAERAALTPAAGGVVADTLRTLLQERDHRTDGDLQALADRCLHLSRGDRDLIAMRGRLIDELEPAAAPAPPAATVEELAGRFGSEYGTRNGAQPYWDFDRTGLLAFAAALSAPPPADAVRALPAKWRVTSHQAGQGSAGNKARRRCADELERALSAAPAALLTNPYTGTPRDYRDVESDPEGVLIVKAGEPLPAAAPTPEGRDSETVLPCDLTLTDVWVYHRDRTTASGLTPDARTRHSQMAGVIHRALTQQEGAMGFLAHQQRQDWRREKDP